MIRITPEGGGIHIWTPKTYTYLVCLKSKVRIKEGLHVYLNTECHELQEQELKKEIARSVLGIGNKAGKLCHLSIISACGMDIYQYRNPSSFFIEDLLENKINCLTTAKKQDAVLFSIVGDPVVVLRGGESQFIRARLAGSIKVDSGWFSTIRSFLN